MPKSSRRERSVARKNINLEILDMSVFDKFTRFDRKDENSLKKTVFDEIRVKVSVDLAWVARWKSVMLKELNYKQKNINIGVLFSLSK